VIGLCWSLASISVLSAEPRNAVVPSGVARSLSTRSCGRRCDARRPGTPTLCSVKRGACQRREAHRHRRWLAAPAARPRPLVACRDLGSASGPGVRRFALTSVPSSRGRPRGTFNHRYKNRVNVQLGIRRNREIRVRGSSTGPGSADTPCGCGRCRPSALAV
jgi:hypothetical protein